MVERIDTEYFREGKVVPCSHRSRHFREWCDASPSPRSTPSTENASRACLRPLPTLPRPPLQCRKKREKPSTDELRTRMPPQCGRYFRRPRDLHLPRKLYHRQQHPHQQHRPVVVLPAPFPALLNPHEPREQHQRNGWIDPTIDRARAPERQPPTRDRTHCLPPDYFSPFLGCDDFGFFVQLPDQCRLRRGHGHHPPSHSRCVMGRPAAAHASHPDARGDPVPGRRLCKEGNSIDNN